VAVVARAKEEEDQVDGSNYAPLPLLPLSAAPSEDLIFMILALASLLSRALAPGRSLHQLLQDHGLKGEAL